MYKDLLFNLKGITPEEFQYTQQIMSGMDEHQARRFVMFYSGKRQSANDLLLYTLLGLVIIAGIQRFVTGQIGMGIVYLLTFGLCFIGTIVDAVNHKNMANEFNQKMALECAQLVKMGM
ncbi:TM2 domain-containing protein [Paradesertivirga mongoliensis]|uniref:TM2 domain-containing protein n=1 Tax=Paradesertivirga mongoliensis TaxID=2100740 RepID=A0ABW4ZID4_9SPHI|nr:TM2 domain-containing protein [Pedobacter mongoliensis]